MKALTFSNTSESQALTVSESLSTLLKSATSENTRSSYLIALNQFNNWVPTGAPLSDSICAEYVSFIEQSGRAVASAKMFSAAMNKLSSQNNQPSPIGSLTKSAIAGFSRQARNRGRGQAQGIGWESADFIAKRSSELGSLSGIRNAAIVAVMSDGLLRISEVSNLTVSDFQVQSDGSGRLTIQHSKTDQSGQGATVYLGQPTTNLVNHWLSESGISDGYLFRSIRKGSKALGTSKLSTVSIRTSIKQAAENAGIENVRGHSLRVGSAQSLASRGASLVAMQQAGRWNDPSMPSHYAKAELAARGAVAKLRYG